MWLFFARMPLQIVATRKPADQKQAETNMALRGPFASTHVPPIAADRPSITMAMLKTMPTAVWPASKWATKEFL